MGKLLTTVAVSALGASLILAAAAPPEKKLAGAKPPAHAQKTQSAIDPICGMTVNPEKAAGKSEHKGATYYFCSDYCKRKFDADPEAALKKAPPKQ